MTHPAVEKIVDNTIYVSFSNSQLRERDSRLEKILVGGLVGITASVVMMATLISFDQAIELLAAGTAAGAGGSYVLQKIKEIPLHLKKGNYTFDEDKGYEAKPF